MLQFGRQILLVKSVCLSKSLGLSEVLLKYILLAHSYETCLGSLLKITIVKSGCL